MKLKSPLSNEVSVTRNKSAYLRDEEIGTFIR